MLFLDLINFRSKRILVRHLNLLCLLLFSIPVLTQAQVSIETLKTVVAAFHAEYDQELATKQSRIVVNPAPTPAQPDFWWNLADVRAAYAALYDKDSKVLTHYLYLLGGYGKLAGMTQDGIAATLCHELGHGIGGPPYKAYKDEDTDVSVEGQADYFAFRYCLPRIFKRLKPNAEVKSVNAHTDSLCKHIPQARYSLCTRVFQALEVERTFFRLNKEDPTTNYSTPDSSISTEVNKDPYFYPSSQCRLDTMMAGLFEKERPRCWYLP